MSNGDHDYKHAVIRTISGMAMLCKTDSGEPAVYADPAPAELMAAKLRNRFPECTFSILSFQVL